MNQFSRRELLATLYASGTGLAFAPQASAQAAGPLSAAPIPRFGYDDVVRRARELATAPFQPAPPLPDALAKVDFDAWRGIRYRPDKAFFAGTPFRLEMFHLGHLYRQPVTINIIRDGIATPIPYSAALFDYGGIKFDQPLPINLGFAGFRLHYPINDPRVYDEVVSFLGASYFRILGRGQRYGLSARALAVGNGTQGEEFPYFREFWIETPDANAGRATIYGLLDGPSLTGAYRFDLYPASDTVFQSMVTLNVRKAGVKIGWAPLTSMFYLGQNDRRSNDDFRPEVHDSDGLLLNSGTGEWIWRPLRNPTQLAISAFLDKDIHGFGLFQRNRNFDHYQDLDLAYEQRPSYWIEPKEGWGSGQVELLELPTADETDDNIVASWVPADAPDPAKPITFNYQITASLDLVRLSPNGRAINTYQTFVPTGAEPDPGTPHARRFLIDFSGGDLAYFAEDSTIVNLVPTTTNGRILNASLVPNTHVKGFRATIDVLLDAGQSTDLRAFLRSGNRTLTETWTFPWRSPD